jgi:hypothetical protein
MLKMKHWDEMLHGCAKLYALKLWKYLNPESLDKIKRQPDYEFTKLNQELYIKAAL